MSSPDFNSWESSSQIDPLIFRLLQKKYENSPNTTVESPVKKRQLGAMYAVYIGIGAMIITILLGAIRGNEADAILIACCCNLLVFSVIGFIAGKIAEVCVRESVKSMIGEMLQRTAEQRNTAPEDVPTGE